MAQMLINGELVGTQSGTTITVRNPANGEVVGVRRNGDRLTGVFSERDVVRRVVERGLDPSRTTVGDVMTPDLVVGDA
ncbi:MAG: hypothetical protein HYY42_07125, partial [Chloroflexi bacterium]|nr:hypothetical protein [Chloroflexota bacterium]